jgi:predicted dehydrogenase
VKVLVVGLGGIGQRHVRNLRTLLGSEVDIIAYRTKGLRHVLTDHLQIEAGGDLEEKYQIYAYEDLDRALAEGLDAAFICHRSALHIRIGLPAAKAGRRPRCPYVRLA